MAKLYASFASFSNQREESGTRDNNRVVSKKALNDCQPRIALRKSYTMFEKKRMMIEGDYQFDEEDFDSQIEFPSGFSSHKQSPILLNYLPPLYEPTEQQQKVLGATEKETKLTPLHLASENGHLHIVQYLCDRGVDVNATTTSGDTPLHMAARADQLVVVKHLLQRGAERNISNDSELTPEDIAVAYGRNAIVTLLRSAVIVQPDKH